MPLPTIPSGNVASALGGAYEVANSCRFNKADSARMVKTPSGSGNVDRWTFSCWIKRGKISDATHTIFCGLDGSDTHCVRFNSNDKLDCHHYDGAYQSRLETDRVFRDCSAWYNIIYVYDSGNGTANDRQKIYINGVEETLFANRVNADSGEDGIVSVASKPLYVGDKGDGGEYFDGYMAEVCLVDGQALTPTSFGEFDEDSPRIWKPIDVSGLTFGTNGFYLDFEASGNLGNDANGGTDLTEANLDATDSSTDTPTNNFCVLNPLVMPTSTLPVISNGNTNLVSQNASSKYFGGCGTFGLTAGKWYWEVKLTDINSAGSLIGISDRPEELARNNYDLAYFMAYGYGIKDGDGNIRNNTSGSQVDSSYGVSYTDNDIIGVHLDLDNNKLYYAKNGTLMNSGTGFTTTAVTNTNSGFWFPTITDTGTNAATWQVNFGGSSGFSISSAASDANGYGNFEYSPSGTFDSATKNFLAICTKNLGSDGG